MSKIRYKVIKDYNAPTEQEIVSKMDFSAVVSGINAQTAAATTVISPAVKILTGVILSAAIVVSVYFIRQMYEPDNKVIAVHELADISSPQKTVLVTPEEVGIAEFMIKASEKPEAKATAEKKNKPIPKAAPAVTPNVFVKAEPLAGFQELYKYLNTSITYPLLPPADTLEGKVLVRFTIGTDGEIENPEVIESMGRLFDREALRVVVDMPEWKPATRNGIPVAVTKQVSIRFRKKHP